MTRQIKNDYRTKVCEAIEALREEGFINIHIEDIAAYFNQDRDLSLIGPSEFSAQLTDLRTVMGRQIREMIEERHDGLRVMPLPSKFFKEFPKTKHGGPDQSKIEAYINKEWNKRSANDERSFDEFALSMMRTFKAGATTAVGLRFIKDENDPFFAVYEFDRHRTVHRAVDNVDREIESGPMHKDIVKAIRSGSRNVIEGQFQITKKKSLKNKNHIDSILSL